MMDQLIAIKDKILEFWNKYTAKQKTIIICVACAILIAIVLLAYFMTRPVYTDVATLSGDSATTFDKETLYYVFGVNKIRPTLEEAITRARTIAAPLNARRLNRKTPCALKEEMKCYDCKSPERICNGLTVLWRKMGGVKECEVVLIQEDLGY